MSLTRLTLWRYISARFAGAILGTFAASFILLFLISLVDAMAKAGSRGDAGIFMVVKVAFYGTPAMTEQMLPFSVLVGAMASFFNLSRRQELVVARSIGVSVWQVLAPALIATALIGTVAVTIYNPLAAHLMEERSRLQAEHFGGGDTLLSITQSGLWLRQDGVDGQSVLHAAHGSHQGRQLANVTIFLFGDDGTFAERVEARHAALGFNNWELSDAWVITADAEPQFYQSYMVSTYLTPEQVQQSLGNPDTVSFWNLPLFIAAAERAGVPANAFKLRHQSLLSLPFLLGAMVLIAATVSLKLFRSGGIGTMVLTGLGAGLGLFLANEIMRDIGSAGLLPPPVAVWLPLLLTALAATTVLLYQEDG